MMKSPKSPATPSSKKVKICRVDGDKDKAIPIKLISNFDNFLKNATNALELKRPATQIFDENLNRITSLKDIEPGTVLFISCARIPVDESKEPLYKKRVVNYGRPQINLPIIEPENKGKPLPENAAQHQAIAASTNTVCDNMRDSLLAVYASMKPEARAELPESEELQKLLNNTQNYLFHDSLVSEFIAPTTDISEDPHSSAVLSYVLNKMRGMKPNECRFIVTGPIQSGKTTMLSTAAMIFFQKAQISDELKNYLIVPTNFLIHQYDLTDFNKILGLLVIPTMRALRIHRPDFAPYIPTLQQYFLSLNAVALPTFPPTIAPNEELLRNNISALAARIHKLWNTKSALKEYVEICARFPNEIASIFGFSAAVPVYDHFELCAAELRPSGQFSESEKPASIPEAFCKAMEGSPFFVASQNDVEFFKYFTCQYTELTTLRIITEQPTKKIIFADPPYTLKSDVCEGCPAYCSYYDHLCKAIEDMNAKNIGKLLPRIRSIVDVSRRADVQQEMIRFVNLFDEGEIPVEILEGVQNTEYFSATVQ
jgi:hypothetical protein